MGSDGGSGSFFFLHTAGLLCGAGLRLKRLDMVG
jgi:hypothetical protein